jgi:hypothetical protein
MVSPFNPSAQGTGESLAKLLRRHLLLLGHCCGVIHFPGGIVKEFMCLGVVVFSFSLILVYLRICPSLLYRF